MQIGLFDKPPEQVRECNKCGDQKPLLLFPFRDKAKGIRANQCRDCNRAYLRNYYRKRKSDGTVGVSILEQRRSDELKSGTRTCNQCGKERPLSEYYARYRICRSCRIEYVSEWKRNNPGKVIASRRRRRHVAREYQRRWRESNRDKYSEQCRQYYHKNRSHLARYHRQWRKANGDRSREIAHSSYHRNKDLEAMRRRYAEDPEYRESRLARQRAWRLRNRERVRESRRLVEQQPYYRMAKRVRVTARRARRAGATGTHSVSDIVRLWYHQRGSCYWCGGDCGSHPYEMTTYHVDHITPLSRGGTNWPRNLAITCPSCNLSKSDKYPIEFKAYRLNLESLVAH